LPVIEGSEGRTTGFQGGRAGLKEEALFAMRDIRKDALG